MPLGFEVLFGVVQAGIESGCLLSTMKAECVELAGVQIQHKVAGEHVELWVLPVDNLSEVGELRLETDQQHRLTDCRLHPSRHLDRQDRGHSRPASELTLHSP